MFQFGDYRRPGQIAIYKSADFGKTFQPWHFMVTQQHECTDVFGIPESEIYVLPDNNVQRVLCQQYTGYPYDFGEKVNKQRIFIFDLPSVLNRSTPL